MEIKIANSFFKKFLGLMFKSNIKYGMYFPNTNMIHTFFMKENIDIIGLDNNNIINEIRLNVKPGKIIILKSSIHTLEVPNNTQNYKIGDKVIL